MQHEDGGCTSARSDESAPSATAAPTPGPWRLEEEDFDEAGVFGEATVWADGDGTSAKLDVHIATIRCGLRESQANARLINAAPELLVASKWALEVAKSWHANHGDTIECDLLCRIIAPLESAIAKATGGAR